MSAPPSAFLLAALLFLGMAGSAPADVITTHFLSGTGFFVNSDGYVVTNNHVVQGCKSVSVQGAVPEMPATVVARDVENDLALIRANVSPPATALLRADYYPLQKDESAVTVGFPTTQGLTMREATIVDNKGPGGEEKWVQFSDSVTNGNSGGPLLDMSANVVGVVMAKMESYYAGHPENIVRRADIAIALPVVRQFLTNNRIRYRESNGGGLLIPDRVQERAKEYIVNVRCVQ